MKINKKAQIMGSTLSNAIILIVFLVLIVVSGILAGMVYFDVNLLQTSLETIDFPIPVSDNTTFVAANVSSFQDVLKLTIYPIFGVFDALPYLTYFMIFGFIIAMGIMAYLSSKNPVFFVLHLLFTILITYFCMLISNMYAHLLENPFLNNMMMPFTIYNKLMLYLPQIIFFTSLFFGAIAFINLIKPQTNASSNAINYGGDY